MADNTEITLTQDQVDDAVKSEILTSEQGSQLWLFCKERQLQRVSHFDYISVLQYLGMAGVLVAMGHFVHNHHLFGHFGLAQISFLYTTLFFAFGYWLWKQPCYRFGGGLFLTLSVCMMPLLLYGIENGLGQWPQLEAEQLMAGEEAKQYDLLVRSHQIRLEVATVVGAMVMLNFFPFPLLLLPMVISGWLLFLDALPVLFPFNLFLWNELLEITAAYGAGVLLFAYKADRKHQSVFASWGYFLGLALSWSAVTALIWDSSELIKACYCLGNGVLLLLSFVFNRTVFLLFGALGVLGYCCYLAYLLFSNPFTYSLVISLISISALYLGVFFQKHQKRLFI